MTNRRAFLFGAASLLAAPAIVRADSLMKVFAPKPALLIPYSEPLLGWIPCDGRILHREMYADLFAAIGTTYGRGEREGTFRLPEFTIPRHLQARHFGTDAPIPIETSIRALPMDDQHYGNFPVGSLVQSLGWPT